MKMHKQLGALARLARKYRRSNDPRASNVVIAPAYGPHGIAYARLSTAGESVDVIVDLQPGQIVPFGVGHSRASVMISPEYLAAAVASAEGRGEPLAIDDKLYVGGFAGEAVEGDAPERRRAVQESVEIDDPLKRVARFASRGDDKSRYWIEAIYIAPREGRAAATNGHYLALDLIADGNVSPVLVPIAAFDVAVSLRCRTLSIVEGRDTQEFWGDGIVVRFKPLDASQYSPRIFQIAERAVGDGRTEIVCHDTPGLLAHLTSNVTRGKALRAKAEAVVTRVVAREESLTATSSVNGLGKIKAAFDVTHGREKPALPLTTGLRSSYFADAVKAASESASESAGGSAGGLAGMVRIFIDRSDPRGSPVGFAGGTLTIALMPCRLDD